MKKPYHLINKYTKKLARKNRNVVLLIMQHIQGISRHQLLMSSLKDTITAANPVRFIDTFVNHLNSQASEKENKILTKQYTPQKKRMLNPLYYPNKILR